MKRLRPWLFPFVLFVVAAWLMFAAFGGCASVTPERQLLVATEAYASTMRVANAMLLTGLINIEEAESIEQCRAVARRALDRWRAGLLAGEPAGGRAAAFELAMAVLESEITRAQGGPSDGSD